MARTVQKLKILIVGSGGREHAVGWKVAQSPRAGELFFAPGNGGTAGLGTNVDIQANDIAGLLEFAKNNKIDLTLALPDEPLALGIVDTFQKVGFRIFGPTKSASQLEWSKAFSKNFMKKYNLPTAEFKTFTNYNDARAYVADMGAPIVVKVSSLALGKGVVVAQSLEEANEALDNVFVKKVFGNDPEVVIEEFLTGPEVSVHAFSDGKNYAMFPIAQDHKTIGEGNTGPNTGGMGSVAPVQFVANELVKKIEKEIVASTFAGMRKDKSPFNGLLFPGLMLTKNGPKILEYNARFGDPETQSFMRLLDTDIIDIFDACIDGTLDTTQIKWKDCFACNIVLASGGYPGSYEKGKVITGPLPSLPLGKGEEPDVVIFHAGTKLNENGELVTNGGRVLGVSAVGDTLQEALDKAYKAIESIHFDGMYYRKDIGADALKTNTIGV